MNSGKARHTLNEVKRVLGRDFGTRLGLHMLRTDEIKIFGSIEIEIQVGVRLTGRGLRKSV